MTHMEDLAGYLKRKVRRLPGVLNAVIEIVADTFGLGFHATGWIEVEVCDEGILTRSLEDDFLSICFDMNFLFATSRSDDIRLAVLIVERQRQANLAPGFHKVNYLTDGEESALVEFVGGQLAQANDCLIKAVGADAVRDCETAKGLLSTARQRLVHAATAMSWRRTHFNERLHPAGPFLVLASPFSLDGQDLRDAIRNLTSLVRHATTLCHEHFDCETRSDINLEIGSTQGVGPLWYGKTQAVQYDQCRYFPREIARPINRVLDAFVCREVVELGAGTGRFTLALLEADARQSFSVVDSSVDMLDRLRAKLQQSNRDNVSIVHSGIDRLDPACHKFDAIIEHEAFFMHPNPDRLARHLASLLNPMGLLMRLERTLADGEEISQLTNHFDQEVAAGIGGPVGFVGEGINNVMDASLDRVGLASIRVALVQVDRQAKLADVVNARRHRAFPYLEHVPQYVIDNASTIVLNAGFPETLRIVERYDLAVSMRMVMGYEARLRCAAELLLDAILSPDLALLKTLTAEPQGA